MNAGEATDGDAFGAHCYSVVLENVLLVVARGWTGVPERRGASSCELVRAWSEHLTPTPRRGHSVAAPTALGLTVRCRPRLRVL